MRRAAAPQQRRTAVRPTNDRIVIVLILSLGGLGVLWVRCAYLQVVGASRYRAIADLQHESIQPLRARRGTVYDRNGRVLAVSVPVPSVFANARQVVAKRDMAKQLSRLVDRDAGMIQHRLEQDKGFVWIARQIDPATKPTLLTMRREGIAVTEESKRMYPNGRMAGHLVGFVDIDQRGLEGLELAFNGILRGQDGWRSTMRDAKGSLLMGPWTVSYTHLTLPTKRIV